MFIFNNWKRELKLIDNLGKLYPKIEHGIQYEIYRKNNKCKAYWVCCLCVFRLKRRLPHLEKFIKNFDPNGWYWYRKNFIIKDDQCGKEN